MANSSAQQAAGADISLNLPREDAALQPLTPQEEARAHALADGVDLSSPQGFVQFGIGAQRRLADQAGGLLARMGSQPLGEAQQQLHQLIAMVDSLGADGVDRGGWLDGLLGGPARRMRRMGERFEAISARMDRVAGELDQTRMALLKDVGVLEELYRLNAAQVRELEVVILAGERALDRAHGQLAALRGQSAGGDPLAGQAARDMAGSIARFEQRLHDLMLSRMVGMQTAPQIRLVQDNNRLLAEKMQTAIYTALPLWRQQMVVALGLARQQSALEAQQQVNRATGQFLRRNARQIRQQGRAVQQEIARGIVEADTLQAVNAELLGAIQDSLDAQEQARQRRAQAERELADAQARMRQALAR